MWVLNDAIGGDVTCGFCLQVSPPLPMSLIWDFVYRKKGRWKLREREKEKKKEREDKGEGSTYYSFSFV